MIKHMKYLISLAVFLTFGVGCTQHLPWFSSTNITSRIPGDSVQQIESDTVDALPVLPRPTNTPPLTDHEPPEHILRLTRELRKDRYPDAEVLRGKSYFKLSPGEFVNFNNGCSYNPSFTNRYTLDSIENKEGHWIMHFTKDGPLNIKTQAYPPGEDAKPAAWQMEFAKTQSATTRFTWSQNEPLDYNRWTGALFETNGAYVPIFVSSEAVYFQYVGLSC